MAYKKLTEEGKKFIRNACKGTGNSKISGSNSYELPNSGQPAGTVYTAIAVDHKGNSITTNEQLGEALIYWFDYYGNQYSIDANIIAAQAYQESTYNIWTFSKTGAQGISQFLSGSLYDIAIGQISLVSEVLPEFTDAEIAKLTTGLQNPKQQSSYVYRSSNSSLDIALANRAPFFQNIINNPELSIKAQCRFMAALLVKGNNKAASCLFGYNRGQKYVKDSYTKTVAAGKNGDDNYGEGLNYVKRIFEILGKKESAPSGFWFGYKNIDFTYDSFTADVKSTPNQLGDIDISKNVSKNYTIADLTTTSTGIINIPNKIEYNRLKSLANNVLERINSEILGGNAVLKVNSSFRSNLVNSAVGGVQSSQHRFGEAADVRILDTSYNLKDVFYQIIASDIVYDQIIYEDKGDSVEKKWIHISYKADEHNRKDKKLAVFINGVPKYTTIT